MKSFKATISQAFFFTLACLLGVSASYAQEKDPADTQKEMMEQKLKELFVKISGKESMPAKEVFENIQQLENMPAERFLNLMPAFSMALGVNCTHCHVDDQWAKEDKPAKQITRDMLKLVTVINKDQLKNIKNLKGKISVTCWTCHRGQTEPEFRVPSAETKK